jgi:hypothetical protein
MSHAIVGKPDASEYASSFGTYINLVQSDDVMAVLAEMPLAGLRSVSGEASLMRYAPGKWSLREVVGHVIDTERIFAYRALRFARNDSTELTGFEQDDYIPAAHFDRRPWSELLDEFELVRRGNLLLFGGFDGEAWLRRGVANGVTLSVRALVYAIAGHELHHLRIIRTKYLPGQA